MNQGNLDYLECGTIVGGPCDGDEFWSMGVYQANDQEGCSNNGITSIIALDKNLFINGKCESRCSLGWSFVNWTTPINNWGPVVRSVNAI